MFMKKPFTLTTLIQELNKNLQTPFQASLLLHKSQNHTNTMIQRKRGWSC